MITSTPTLTAMMASTPLSGSVLDDSFDRAEALLCVWRLPAKTRCKVKAEMPQRRAQVLDALQGQQQAGGFAPSGLMQALRQYRQ